MSEYQQIIAKVEDTFLGYEGHGILTASLVLSYGDCSHQATPQFGFDSWNEDERRRIGTAYGCEFIARLIRACGVDSWEKVKGRTIFALKTDEFGLIKGIQNLPTEPGERFVFDDLKVELEAVQA